MGVNTNMLAGADQMAGSRATCAGDERRARARAGGRVVVEGSGPSTSCSSPPDVPVHLQRKAADIDRWLAGMRRLQARMAAME
jgi:hypothetical protein